MGSMSQTEAYSNLSDYISGLFGLRINTIIAMIRALDVNDFKLLYELLAVSLGWMKTAEIPSQFQ